MKSILEVIILLLLSFLIGSNKSVDTACSLPDTSQWSVANSDICLKVNGDSIFWTMKSDKKGYSCYHGICQIQFAYFRKNQSDVQLTFIISRFILYLWRKGMRYCIVILSMHPYVSRKMINWYFIHLRVILLFFVVKTKNGDGRYADNEFYYKSIID